MIAIVGRSSSHYTRVARIFAFELGVPYTFRPVLDMTSLDPTAYGDNPALKVPSLVDEDGPLFGTENICRAILRRSSKAANVAMRCDVTARVVANAEEMALHAMSTEVTIVMTKLSGMPTPPKLTKSLAGAMQRLDDDWERVLAELPSGRALSFVEVATYCLVTHLSWRDVMDIAPYTHLAAFCRVFGERESARTTEYRFDAA